MKKLNCTLRIFAHAGAMVLLAAATIVLPGCSGTDRRPDSPYVLDKKEHLLALLRQYSPAGYRIVDGYYRLPGRFTLGGYTVTARKVDLTPYVLGSTKFDLLLAVEPVVHEICHGYSFNGAYDLIAKSKISFEPNGYYYIQFLPGRETRLIKTSRSVFTHAMLDYVPNELRGPAFSYMENPSSDVYLLHNEMAAYYHGTAAGLDIAPAMKEKEMRDAGTWRLYLQSTGISYCMAVEMKYLVVTCIMAQEQIDRQSHEAVMANREFLNAFLEMADALPALRRRLNAERDYFLGALRKSGLNIRRKGDDFVITRNAACFTLGDPGAAADRYDRALEWADCRQALRRMRLAAVVPRR